MFEGNLGKGRKQPRVQVLEEERGQPKKRKSNGGLAKEDTGNKNIRAVLFGAG